MAPQNNTGVLVLVVGPSGAGKDTLIGAAAQHFAGDDRFVFPRRIVTREAVAALEEHDSMDFATFEHMRATGDCALCWEAHGLGYILPREIDDHLAAGRIVVCNVSRRVLPDARQKYPDVKIIEVTAVRDIRAARLATRGRESAVEVVARLRREAAPVPDGPDTISIDNGGALSDGVTAIVTALEALISAPENEAVPGHRSL